MASQGPYPSSYDPGHSYNVDRDGKAEWYDLSNINYNTTSFASIDRGYTSSADYTDYIRVKEFGFSVPSGATIDGILVEIRRQGTNIGPDYVKDSRISIVKSDGSIGSENKADTVNKWPETLTYKSYGGTSDLWSETWTDADINDSDFGVVISALLNNLGSKTVVSAAINWVRITVYYTEGGTAATMTGIGTMTGVGSITL